MKNGSGASRESEAGDDLDPNATVLYGQAAADTRASDVNKDQERVRLDPDGPLQRTDAASRYTLFAEIARGGMGAVIRARDAAFGRDLAIKVLLEHHTAQPDVVRRFVEEAQIGGQLQHPGIVPVHDVGTLDDRRPFIAMKLVHGRTLAALLAERSSPAVDLPRFLWIFEQVAQTMAYAQSRSVVHRDLKPLNIMVGDFGEVQVMDWGLAKVLGIDTPDRRATDEGGADSSRSGSVVGTPAYMAPEQARGETDRIDERADVFGLGATLCEILTGRPPFTGASPSDVLGKAARAETTSALDRLDVCGADPELIALARACLAARPDDRPRDAKAVAHAMGAYLEGVQERLRASELATVEAQARAEEAGKRAKVERDRRRLTAALAASVLAITIGGGLAIGYVFQQRQAQQAEQTRALAGLDNLRARIASDPADAVRWREALTAIEEAEKILGTGADRGTLAALEAQKTAVMQGLTAVERDAALRQALVRTRADQADLGPAGTDAAYARSFRAAGLNLDSLTPAQAATVLRERPSAHLAEVAPFLDHWATVRRDAGRPDDVWRKPLEVARSIDGDDFRTRLRDVLLAEPDQARSAALNDLARAAEAADLPPPTVLLLARTQADTDAQISLLRRALGQHPDDLWLNFTLAATLENARPTPREEAARFYTAARALRPETAHPLAHLLEALGRGREALAVYRELASRRPDDALLLGCYGKCLQDRAQAADARAILDRAISAGRAAIRDQPDVADTHFALANALYHQNNVDDAVTEFRAAIRLQPNFVGARSNLAAALYKQGKLDESIAAFRETIRIAPPRTDLAKTHTTLGIAFWAKGDLERAIAAQREAIRLQPEYADGHFNLGITLRTQGKPNDAAAEFREAIRLQPDMADAYSNLGAILCDVQHDYAGATAAFRTAIRLAPDSPISHANLGIALKAQGALDEAIASFRRAAELAPPGSPVARAMPNLIRQTNEQKGQAGQPRDPAPR